MNRTYQALLGTAGRQLAVFALPAVASAGWPMFFGLADGHPLAMARILRQSILKDGKTAVTADLENGDGPFILSETSDEIDLATATELLASLPVAIAAVLQRDFPNATVDLEIDQIVLRNVGPLQFRKITSIRPRLVVSRHAHF